MLFNMHTHMNKAKRIGVSKITGKTYRKRPVLLLFNRLGEASHPMVKKASRIDRIDHPQRFQGWIPAQMAQNGDLSMNGFGIRV